MTKKSAKKLFNSNIFWAIISLLAALAIWVYTTGTQQEPIEVELNGVEVVFVGEDALQAQRGLVITDVSAQTVDVVIEGARMNIGRLGAEDVQAVVDVSRYTSTGNYNVTYTLAYPEGVDANSVGVVRRSISTVSFQVTRVDTVSVPVEVAFTGSVAEGYLLGDIEYEPTTVEVMGPQSVLETVKSAYAEVALEELNSTREVEAPFDLIDADGNVIDTEGLDLEFNINSITVTIPVSVIKEVPLYLLVTEGAGATRNDIRYTLSEDTITIAGDAAVVDAINRIDIGPVDLTSFELTYSDTLDIVLPNDVQNISGIEEVDVAVEVVGLSVRSFTVTNISYTGLPEQYSAELVTHALSVRIRAEQEVLEALSASNLRAVADLSETTATGTMDTSNVRIYVDGATDAGAVGAYRLTFNITRN